MSSTLDRRTKAVGGTSPLECSGAFRHGLADRQAVDGREYEVEPGGAGRRQLFARVARALDGRGEVLEAYVFGSHARGRARPDSDVDVAVYVDEARARDGVWGYRAELATTLMAALGADDVDVVVLNRAPVLLYHRVLRDGVRVLSRDLRATTTRAGRALSRYFDFLPQLDKMDAARRHPAGRAREHGHRR